MPVTGRYHVGNGIKPIIITYEVREFLFQCFCQRPYRGYIRTRIFHFPVAGNKILLMNISQAAIHRSFMQYILPDQYTKANTNSQTEYIQSREKLVPAELAQRNEHVVSNHGRSLIRWPWFTLKKMP